ncbi:MAG TPA: 1-(5-phosphoribosyl)-5-[(5-phosphoribosylamino)methylideneamino]imidazole-4-carboxamide isomerase [Candidatus Latescibacteria bacterium]|nr:1-(5-phosphoribosyl)-5-[(5-phosphoribosylamino)methylideneamino]imidazole-4-carboxamide isomerase [Candidatus Latescibacterota bacterium]
MLIIPSIDLKDGRCVSLVQGRADKVTVYSDDPVEVALRWQAEGACYLHLVDLDGAFEGGPRNLPAVKRILEAVDIPLELGGGIRDQGSISRLLALGLDRVVIGTVAVHDPELLKRAIDRFGPRRVVVGIDARAGMVAVKGWKEVLEVSAIDLALKVKDLGVERIIYTDIERDGMMTGPNLEMSGTLAQKSGLKVIISGGISSTEDILHIAKMEKFGIDGVIVGKALYEGKVNLREVIGLV